MTGALGNMTLACIAVLLCYGMQATKPHYADLTGPIPVDAGMKDTAQARTFDIHVNRITFARALQADRFGERKLLTSGGIWVVVETSLAATKSSTTLGEAVWQGPTGLAYRITERLAFAPGMPPHALDPGLPRRGLFVFEVPPDQVRGASLLVAARRFAALDSQVRIGLDDVPLDADGQPSIVVPIYDLSTPM